MSRVVVFHAELWTVSGSSVLLGRGEPSPRAHLQAHHPWALDNSKEFTFLDWKKKSNKAAKKPAVRPFSTSQEPEMFFFLRGFSFVCFFFLYIHSCSSPFTWTWLASLFQCLFQKLLPSDVGGLWWSHAECDVGTPWPDCNSCAPKGSRWLPLPSEGRKNHYKHFVGVNNLHYLSSICISIFILFIGETTENGKTLFFFPATAFVFRHVKLIYKFHYLNIHFFGFYFFLPFFLNKNNKKNPCVPGIACFAVFKVYLRFKKMVWESKTFF